jgi:predicted transcriptional regulator of viral defense system
MPALQHLPQGPFTVSDAADRGVSRATVYRLAAGGRLERIGRGLFQRIDAPGIDTDLLEAASRAPLATICLTSALAHHGLVDAIPTTTDLALPRGHRRPATRGAITWHLFDADTFDLGRTQILIDGTSQEIGLYDAPRAIVDVFRLRSIEGYEVGIDAMRAWLGHRGSHPADLMRLATLLPRASGPVRTALEHLA